MTQLDDIEAKIDRILTATEVRQASINDASATTTKFITNLTETAPNFWDRGALLFTSGNNKGLIRGIKNYSHNTKEIQIQTPLSYAPANSDAFIIVPARKFLTPDTSELADAVRTELEAAGTKLTQIKDETAFIKAIEGGRWKVEDNQQSNDIL